MKFGQELPKATYVTGFSSRDPQADWDVGFYGGKVENRHLVVNGEGRAFVPDGVPFVVPISADRGEFLFRHRRFLEIAFRDLYAWLHCPQTQGA